MLIVRNRRHHRFKVELIRQSDDHDVAGRHGGDEFLVQRSLGSRVRGVRIGEALESAVGECALDRRSVAKRFDGSTMLRHHTDFAHFAAPLHLKHAGQDLIVRDHAAADY